MSKQLTISCIFLFVCMMLSAQTEKFKPELAFGINAGTTFSTVGFTSSNRNPIFPQKQYMQYVGGVTARYISEKNFGLQGELNYSQRGWEEYDEDYPERKFSRSLGYLEIPLLTHIYFNTGKRGRIAFNLGPQIGFLLSENTSDDVNFVPTVDGETQPDYYTLDVQHKFDWGICGGGGFELRTGIGSFMVEGRYYFGLSDIFNSSKADPYSKSSNQVINVKLTYFYRK